MPPAHIRTEFDAAYYRRFYRDRPVHSRARLAQLAEGVAGLSRWWCIPIRSVLEVGAGPGWWRDWAAKHHPPLRAHSIDISPYACRRYGHELADIASWQPARPFDLVVCQGVLQYLGDRAATAAIANLAAATRGLLFLEVPTVADLAGTIERSASDLDVHWRTGAWYRRRLRAHFVELGCGLHAPRGQQVPFYELEQAGS